MPPVPLVPPDARLPGRWTRTLLETADGRTDTTTSVTWLQGERLYVDLRLPAGPPPAATCLRATSYDDLLALSAVEGFAGELVADGEWACWRRSVDLQPAGAPDEGRLDPVGVDDVRVVETGRDGSYREHWSAAPAAPVGGLLLADAATGARAVLVHVGDDVGWARGRPLPAGGTLADLVAAAPDLAAAQDLLDAEVALVRDGVVASSSLPWRVGAQLSLSRKGAVVRTTDTAPDGSPLVRTWSVLSSEGSLEAV